MYGYTNEAGEPIMDGAAYLREGYYGVEDYDPYDGYYGHYVDDEPTDDVDPATCDHGDRDYYGDLSCGSTVEWRCVWCDTTGSEVQPHNVTASAHSGTCARRSGIPITTCDCTPMLMCTVGLEPCGRRFPAGTTHDENGVELVLYT